MLIAVPHEKLNGLTAKVNTRLVYLYGSVTTTKYSDMAAAAGKSLYGWYNQVFVHIRPHRNLYACLTFTTLSVSAFAFASCTMESATDVENQSSSSDRLCVRDLQIRVHVNHPPPFVSTILWLFFFSVIKTDVSLHLPSVCWLIHPLPVKSSSSGAVTAEGVMDGLHNCLTTV